MYRLAIQSINQSINQQTSQSINEQTSQSINPPINPRTNRWLYPSIHEPINDSVHPSTNQCTYQFKNKPTDQPTNQLFNQLNHWTSHWINPQLHYPTHQPMTPPISLVYRCRLSLAPSFTMASFSREPQGWERSFEPSLPRKSFTGSVIESLPSSFSPLRLSQWMKYLCPVEGPVGVTCFRFFNRLRWCIPLLIPLLIHELVHLLIPVLIPSLSPPSIDHARSFLHSSIRLLFHSFKNGSLYLSLQSFFTNSFIRFFINFFINHIHSFITYIKSFIPLFPPFLSRSFIHNFLPSVETVPCGVLSFQDC